MLKWYRQVTCIRSSVGITSCENKGSFILVVDGDDGKYNSIADAWL